MWLLLGCSIVVFAIGLERLFVYRSASLHLSPLLQGLAVLIRRKNFAEALRESAATPGPIARVIHAGLLRHDLPRGELREVVREAGQLEVPRLERFLPILFSIAMVAPLIGLLGTLIGLIDTWISVSEGAGFVTPARLSRGVYESLVTSAAGLTVALPAYLTFAYLASKARDLRHDMERAGIEIVNLIDDARRDGEIVEFRRETPKKRQERAGS